MTYDDYFTAEDKPFAEDINTALLLSNVFDLTVPIELPKMFSNSTFVDTTSKRKCGVAIATLKESLPSGVSVSTVDGKSVLTGTGTVKLGFYPNFNSFGKYTSIAWTGTGSITVNLKTTGGSTIASNIANGTITSTSAELQTLQEIVIEIVLSSATLKTLTVTMENKDETRYGAEVGITDVTGLETRLTNIESKNTAQDGRLTTLETTKTNYRKYDIWANDYNPAIDTSITVYVRVWNSNNQRVAGDSVQLLHNDNVVSSKTTDQNGDANWTITCDEWGLQTFAIDNASVQVNVNGWKEIEKYSNNRVTLYSDGKNALIRVSGEFSFTQGEHTLAYIDEDYLPQSNCSTNYTYSGTTYQPVYISSSATDLFVNKTSSASTIGIYCSLYYPLANPQY